MISRAAIAATSAVCASGVRATTSRPLVSLSSRWTEPGARHQRELADRAPAAHSAGCARALPAPGCTTRPAGLLMTSSAASLKTTSSGSASAATRASHRQLAPRCAPAPRPGPCPWPAGGRPSTWTAPASIQSCSRAREYCGRERARAWSRRSPALSGGQLRAVRYGTRRRLPRSEVQPGDSLYLAGFTRRDAKERPLPDVPVPSGAQRRARAVRRPARRWLAAATTQGQAAADSPDGAVQEGAQGPRCLRLQLGRSSSTSA